jgi:hypothetical protein
LPFDQLVDEAHLIGLLGAHRIAGGAHFERVANAGDAGEALGAAGAGEEAELHFRNAELRGRYGDPIVAGERDLEAAAECGAVDRGDDRLGAILDHVYDLRQHRLGKSLGRVELADVRAGEEGLPFRDDHHGLHRRVGIRFLDAAHQPLAHGVAKRVHGRVVRGDDKDVAVAAGGDGAHELLRVLRRPWRRIGGGGRGGRRRGRRRRPWRGR